MDLVKQLEQDFGVNRPILQKDIDYGLSRAAIRMAMKRLVDQGKLNRYSEGIYYIPEKSKFGIRKLSTDAVIRMSYVTDGNTVYGFYTGLKLLNSLRLTTQVPNTPEIVTNKVKSKEVIKEFGKRKAILRRPLIPVNKENVSILKLIELIRYQQFTSIPLERKREVLRMIGIDKESILKISQLVDELPKNVSQEILRSEVLYAIAS